MAARSGTVAKGRGLTSHTETHDGHLGPIDDAHDLDDKGVGDFTIFEGASSGLLDESDVAQAADAIEPGAAAVMLVYENRWAAPFIAAVRRNGGVPIAFERIAMQDLIDALDAAEATAS